MLVPVCLLCWRWHVENAVSSGSVEVKGNVWRWKWKITRKKSSTAFMWTQKNIHSFFLLFSSIHQCRCSFFIFSSPFLPIPFVALNITVIYFYFVFFKHYLWLDVTLYRHFQNDGIKVDYRLCFMFRLPHCCAKFRPFWDA